jgi:hypothetical protein
MMDVGMIVLGIGFFALTWLFTELCDSLGKDK